MFKRIVIVGACAPAANTASHADTLLTEGFDTVIDLSGTGWVSTNLRSPEGLIWGQGFVGPFAAQAGPAYSYAAANSRARRSAAVVSSTTG